MKDLIILCLALVLWSPAAAEEDFPCPECNSVDPCDALNGVVLGPDLPNPIPASVIHLIIRNYLNHPIPNAAVEITFASGLQFCQSMVFQTTTDDQGQATLTLRGGGCLDHVSDAVRIRANGVIIRSYPNAKSPDWAPGSDLRVDLRDLIWFLTRGDQCFDFDNQGGVNLSDTIIFSSGFTPSHSCP